MQKSQVLSTTYQLYNYRHMCCYSIIPKALVRSLSGVRSLFIKGGYYSQIRIIIIFVCKDTGSADSIKILKVEVEGKEGVSGIQKTITTPDCNSLGR